MMFLKNVMMLLILMSLLLSSGCSDLFGKKVVKKPLDSTQFKASCEMDLDAFSKIMKENISSSIKCLQENLHLFIRVVESGRQGYLSRVALQQFLAVNRTDIKPEVIKALKTVFDVNYLIFGEDPNFVSKKNIDELIEFLLMFNEKTSLYYQTYFEYSGRTDFKHHDTQKKSLQETAVEIARGLRKIYNPNRNGQIHTLNIIDVLGAFTTEANVDAMEKVREILWAKSLLVGGEKDIITHEELLSLILNFDSLTVLVFDAVRFNKINFVDNSTKKPTIYDEKLFLLLKDDLQLIKKLIFHNYHGDRDAEHFVYLNEIINAIKMFQSEEGENKKKPFDFDKYLEMIKVAKKIAMGGDDETIRGRDLKNLFNHFEKVIDTILFLHRMNGQKLIKAALNSPLPITDQASESAFKFYINFEELENSNPGNTENFKLFKRLMVDYRFMKGRQKSAYYTDNYVRNFDSLVQTSLIEYVLNLAFSYKDETGPWGTPNGRGGYSMSKEQVTALVQRFKSVLIDLELILPGREAKTAETVTLLGSLFQFQSDDNKLFDVNEATEFATSLFTSTDISKKLETDFSKIPSSTCKKDRWGRIEPQCFRNNFFKTVCHEYQSYFPKLFSSLVGRTSDFHRPIDCSKLIMNEANLSFLNQTIRAARTCKEYSNGEEIYYARPDYFNIFLALMHIETTIMRWDVADGGNGPRDNMMNYNEVMRAYNIYSPALDGFLESKPAIIKKFKKAIFKYMVIYEKVPDESFSSIWKLIKITAGFENKKVVAHRKTVSSILTAISEAGSPSTFDCDRLRDPINLPETPPPWRRTTEITLSFDPEEEEKALAEAREHNILIMQDENGSYAPSLIPYIPTEE